MPKILYLILSITFPFNKYTTDLVKPHPTQGIFRK